MANDLLTRYKNGQHREIYGGFPGWQGKASAPQKEIDHLKQCLLAI